MKIKDKEYFTRKLDAFETFELARRLAPVLAVLSMQKDLALLKRGFAQSFTTLVGQMSRSDIDEIFSTCLIGATREERGRQAPVYVGGKLMFSDIGIDDLLELVWDVIVKAKLIDFFAAPSSPSTEEQDGQTSSGSDSQTGEAG